MRSISLIRALFVGALLLTVCIEALGVTGREVGARYLVITHDNFYESILPLAQWKHKKGMMAKVVKLSEIGYTAPEIRAYVLNAYLTWATPPEYILLVGDTEYLPTYHMLTHTDNYYADMESNYLAEILVGRFSADSPSHCETMVSKTLGYERTPWLEDVDWFEKATLIVRDDYDSGDSIYYGDTWYIWDRLMHGGYVQVDTFFRKNGSTTSDVISAINEGRTFVTYRGQGIVNWWDPFSVNPYGTNNGFKLPVVLSGTCATGSFHDDGFVCESWVRAGASGSPRGAVGFFGTNTIGGGSYISSLRGAVVRGFFKTVFDDSIFTLGGACLGAKFNLYQLYNDQREYEGWNLLGDPELNLWTSKPDTLDVSHPSNIPPGPNDFTVMVFHNTNPVRDALVCVAMDTSVYDYGYTDPEGEVTFSIAPSNDGTLWVTATAHNYLPYEGECLVGTGIEENESKVKSEKSRVMLRQNHPNPFTRSTTIRFSVQGSRGAEEQRGDVSTYQPINLSIYDLTGRLVKTLVDGYQSVTSYESPVAVRWDGRDDKGNPVPGGVYLIRMSVGNCRETRKMVLVK